MYISEIVDLAWKLLTLVVFTLAIIQLPSRKGVQYGTRFDVPSPSRKTKTNIKTMLPDLSSYAYFSICTPDNISTSDQCCFNVVNQSWNNVRRWKWNKIRRRIFNVAQRWYNVSDRRWSNVETTLIQHCFNLVSTLAKPILNPIGLVLIVDCVIWCMLNTLIVFILLYKKAFF